MMGSANEHDSPQNPSATFPAPSITDSVGPLNGSADAVVLRSKAAQVEAACEARDLATLVDLATSPLGLATDDCRRRAWPLLLGSDNPVEALSTWENISTGGQEQNGCEEWPAHEDERQAGLDVDRSFVYYPKGEGERQLARRKTALRALIVRTLRRHPYLSYFQGYHDIVQVFLLVLGYEKAVDAVARLSLLRIRDYMLPTIAAAKTHLELLPYILRAADPRLEKHLAQIPPYFGISSTLTLYAHEIEEYGDIARLFDFLLAQPASVSIYLFAAVVCSRKQEILQIEPDEGDMLYAILSKLPKPLNLERLISETIELHQRHPPPTLPGSPWRKVDAHSVLKTTQDVVLIREQSLEQGHLWFLKQERKLRRDELLHRVRHAMWVYRRPVRSVGIAVAVAVLAYWVRRDTGATTPMWVSAMKRLRGVVGI